MRFRSLKRTAFAVSLFLLTSRAQAEVVVEGKQLVVDGEPHAVRGMNYTPTPIGGVGGFDFTQNLALCAADFADMQKLGANTVRLYVDYELLFDHASGSLRADVLERYGAVLSAAGERGLRAILNYWLPHGLDYGNPELKNLHAQRFAKVVSAFSAERFESTILLFALGNENNLAQNLGTSTEALFSFYEHALGAAKALPARHPLTVVLVDNGDLFNPALLASVPSADVWSMNIYQYAPGYDAVLGAYASDKPLLFTEFGSDAYNGGEDQATQAAFFTNRWQKYIEPSLSAFDPSAPLLGGVVFEWSDEWWKAGNPGTQDLGGFPGNVEGDGTMNEEWFGICSALPAGSAGPRVFRQAFQALQAEWTKPLYAQQPSSGDAGGAAGAGTTGGAAGGQANAAGSSGAPAQGGSEQGPVTAQSQPQPPGGCSLARRDGGAWSSIGALVLLTARRRRQSNLRHAAAQSRNL